VRAGAGCRVQQWWVPSLRPGEGLPSQRPRLSVLRCRHPHRGSRPLCPDCHQTRASNGHAGHVLAPKCSAKHRSVVSDVDVDVEIPVGRVGVTAYEGFGVITYLNADVDVAVDVEPCCRLGNRRLEARCVSRSSTFADVSRICS
jgi:hypothetical protein